MMYEKVERILGVKENDLKKYIYNFLPNIKENLGSELNCTSTSIFHKSGD